MGLVSTLFVTAIAVQAVIATPIRARTEYPVKETHTVPKRWTQTGKAPGNHMLHMQIGLKQGNFEELERHLYEGIIPTSSTLDDRF